MLKLSVILLFTLLSASVAGQEMHDDCYNSASICQLEAQMELADTELNKTYRKIMQSIKNNGYEHAQIESTTLKQPLVEAQRAWIDFRDKNCNAYYVLNSGGAQRNEAMMECVIEMTKKRTQYLKDTY